MNVTVRYALPFLSICASALLLSSCGGSLPSLKYRSASQALGSDGTIMRYDTEPNTSLWRRASVNILSHLPIEWLL